ncbi:hypothetical protein [Methylomonas denitrificans]|uniref:Uncharacterized protein n=2 Tax=Methylomonas TaxID=416 RepID=A0A140E5P7_9GAMM|nr:hypothetical protein [Methylomonas denitrificans]AMK78721.1 hypothetical protein JT25_019875 [Methylomonas denitrificans]OAH99025.1 hypothetical protein A1342_09525 [Methylomonas methanica]TCV83525.1 hypothetical protein EDE11_10982 [Methylomonas methanica]
MFTLPSIWNLLITTIVFIWVAKRARGFLDNQGLSNGTTRSLLVFTLASLLSWGSGEVVDWTEAKIQGKPQTATRSTQEDIAQLLEVLNQVQSANQTKPSID